MFSTFIRLGLALSSAAVLSSCGGNSVAETQQSTAEGLFSGTYNVYLGATSPATTGTPTCTQNVLTFVEATGLAYNFYPSAANPALLYAADEGSLAFGGNVMSSTNMLQVSLPGSPIPGCTPVAASRANSYALTGSYVTGQSMSGTISYPLAVNGQYIISTFGITNATGAVNSSFTYDTDYQGVQDLSHLAGTYSGMIGTSLSNDPVSFTISPPSVPANSGNSLGVSIMTGTTASGCIYVGSVSPLFKGNGYTATLTSGPTCLLPTTQFSGLLYLNSKTNIAYAFMPNAARSDGLVFSGTRN